MELVQKCDNKAEVFEVMQKISTGIWPRDSAWKQLRLCLNKRMGYLKDDGRSDYTTKNKWNEMKDDEMSKFQ